MINVYIMSGPPGSGKSHQAIGFAKVMHSEGEEGEIISADHFWSPNLRDLDGICFDELDEPSIIEGLQQYEFDISKLSIAHQRCMRTFIYALQDAVDEGTSRSLIVDNTNINAYEISPYYLISEAFGAKVEILRVETPLSVCIERNIHSVPKEKIEHMYQTFVEMLDIPWEAPLGS